MPKQLYCCVNTCDSSTESLAEEDQSPKSKLRFFKFPVNDPDLRARWIGAVDRGPDFIVTPETVVCSRHFVSGKKSLNPNSVDYVPSVIEPAKVEGWKKPSYCGKCRKLIEACSCEKEVEDSEEEEAPEEEPEVVKSPRKRMRGGSTGRGRGRGRGGRGGGRGRGRPRRSVPEESESDATSTPAEESSASEAEEEAEAEATTTTAEPDEEAEESPDDGQVEEADDDEWAPDKDAEDEPPKPKRGRRSGAGAGRASNGSGRGRGRGRGRPSTIIAPTILTPTGNANVNSNSSGSASTPRTMIFNNSPVAANSKSSSTSPAKTGHNYALTKDLPQSKLLERIRDLETESSLKIENLQRTHNMKIAALKEDFTQRMHRAKTEWDNEKANLVNELEICKAALEQSGVSTSTFMNVQTAAGVGHPGNIIIIPTATEEHLQ